MPAPRPASLTVHVGRLSPAPAMIYPARRRNESYALTAMAPSVILCLLGLLSTVIVSRAVAGEVSFCRDLPSTAMEAGCRGV